MKKLTAGIFTVLMGLVSVNAADAAVASKLYVDQKVKVNADAISAMDTAYKAADSGFDTRLQAVEALNGEGAGSVSAQIKAVEDAYKAADTTLDGKISAMDTAYKAADTTLDGKISAMDTAYKAADEALETSLKGYADTELAKKVNKADAKLDEVGATGSYIELVSQLDGKVSATKKEFVAEINEASKDSTVAPQTKAVKSYVDGAISTQGTQVTNLSGRVGALETAVNNALDDEKGILAQANSYADQAELDAISAAGTAADGKISAALADYTTTTDMNTALGLKADKSDTYTKAQVDAAVKVNTDAIAVINNAENGILAQANAYADQAEADAISAANGYTDTEIAKLNLNDLSRVPAACGETGKYCVLTSDGTNYLWEVIERATGEEQPTGTAIPGVEE